MTRDALVAALVLAAVLALPARAWSADDQGSFTASQPLAITSCGQSADALTVSLLAKRMRLDHLFENVLRPERLAGLRTLVVAVGGSVKGLAEAGLNESREIARVNELLAKARAARVAIVAVHLGGESRRGAVSDPFIELVVSKADYLIVTEAGNKDGLFTKASRVRSIPLVLVSQPAEVGRELKALFSPR